MRALTLLFAFASVILISGCHPQHPHHGGDFCPPGHAKKGNC